MYDVNSKYLIGKVVASSLIAGKLSRLCANPLIFVPVILIPLAIMLITNVVHTYRLAKKIAKEETEAAVREAIDEIKQKKNAKENQK